VFAEPAVEMDPGARDLAQADQRARQAQRRRSILRPRLEHLAQVVGGGDVGLVRQLHQPPAQAPAQLRRLQRDGRRIRLHPAPPAPRRRPPYSPPPRPAGRPSPPGPRPAVPPTPRSKDPRDRPSAPVRAPDRRPRASTRRATPPRRPRRRSAPGGAGSAPSLP